MDIHDIVLYIKNNDSPAVLASLTGVEGHSYRKAGAVMLFFENGSMGSLSPGCLESDLQLRTAEIWASGQPEVVEYDMLSPDDFSWGEAVGCGGKIKVVLEPVKGELKQILLAANERMARGESLMLLRKLTSQGGYSYELAAGTVAGPVSDSIAFSTLLQPKPRLVIFGGGHDAGPIAALAATVGFRIAITDWREGTLKNEFPGAERVICAPVEAAARLGISCGDYVLICSHQFQRDRHFLEGVLPFNPHYIGVIGSAVRINLLLEGLEVPSSLHAPVGIPIGGEGPEEIAVSIVAEMIQIKRAGSRKLSKGGDHFESSRYLSSSRTKQTNGSLQGFPEAVPGDFTRERRAQ
ncbi:XdhC family protein [Paenibacillus wynnii]|uniref:XdhC family protein n=1 Tax=Paenibacillus wynnii TaxID=268407 RepID=UPI00279378DD|nr:XdhC family protein [Paenibacillus wynnii]MDQ0195144.1 xanthine dehydrogenase accessory factor [Paenibacillus wynnii]